MISEIKIKNQKFNIKHNLPINGMPGVRLSDALTVYLERNQNPTPKGFVKYINSKTHISGHKAEFMDEKS